MRQIYRSRLAAALFMVTLWMGLNAVALSPKLHQLFHKDAKDADHTCVVTKLQQHSVAPGLVPVIAPLPTDRWNPQPAAPDLQVLLTSDHRLLPSRAPPAV